MKMILNDLNEVSTHPAFQQRQNLEKGNAQTHCAA
jgi:hypothetical protein